MTAPLPSSAKARAEHFLREETAFRLGALPTESSHPKTAMLSWTIQKDLAAGLRMMQSVDREVLDRANDVLRSPEFAKLVAEIVRGVESGNRVFFTGCGATGRLSILLEAAWRRFWQECKKNQPKIMAKLPDREDATFSVMAGGDHALIRSVEGFEDFPSFGEYQLGSAGVGKGDVVVAITEGGETPFVIGTAWKGVEVGASVFFVYNNPSAVLVEHVERSREVIEDDRITKLDLASGPMTVAGSTRMQATTAELLIVGAALESALANVLARYLSAEELCVLGVVLREPASYAFLFEILLDQLESDAALNALAGAVRLEEQAYEHGGLITYMADEFLLDVLTDTTERAPTFRLPPFRKCDDTVSARSWAFVKNPLRDTVGAWHDLLRREPRGLDWTPPKYDELDAPAVLRANPPKLDNEEIYKFRIGNEDDPSRHDAPFAALVAILVGKEALLEGSTESDFFRGVAEHAADFTQHAAIIIDIDAPLLEIDPLFHVPCEFPASPLRLWERLAVKLVANTISTATMARMGRVVGNWMAWVETSNKKLLDRGTRLISELTGVSYEEACHHLFAAIEEVAERDKRTKDAPSPVALVVERLGLSEKYRR